MFALLMHALFCNLQTDPTFYSYTHPLFTDGAETFRRIMGFRFTFVDRDGDQVHNSILPCHSQLGVSSLHNHTHTTETLAPSASEREPYTNSWQATAGPYCQPWMSTCSYALGLVWSTLSRPVESPAYTPTSGTSSGTSAIVSQRGGLNDAITIYTTNRQFQTSRK